MKRKLSERMWVTVRVRRNEERMRWMAHGRSWGEVAYFEVAKCFEKELLWLFSLSRAEVKVISQELGRDRGLEHSHNREGWPVAKNGAEWSTGKI